MIKMMGSNGEWGRWQQLYSIIIRHRRPRARCVCRGALVAAAVAPPIPGALELQIGFYVRFVCWIVYR